jgi:hypothetical protein
MNRATADGAKRETQIPEAIEALGINLTALSEQVNYLLKRIGPAMRPSYPKEIAEKSLKAVSPERAEIADTLNRFRDQVDFMTREVNDALDRLEL